MRKPVQCALKAALVLALGALVSGFPSGAPLSACGHLMPIHQEAEAQTSPPPFIILLSDTNYTSGQPIVVTVTSNEPYMAFMLQGRTEDNKPVGHFSRAPQVAKFLSCYDDNDTLSHAAAFEREAMQVVWHPPPINDDLGDVFITGSIARTKYIFWAVESQRIRGKPKKPRGEPRGNGTDRQTAPFSLVIAFSSLAVLATSMLPSSRLC